MPTIQQLPDLRRREILCLGPRGSGRLGSIEGQVARYILISFFIAKDHSWHVKQWREIHGD